MAEKKMTKEEERSFQETLIKQLIVLSTSGFGVVAALAWNSLVQEFVNSYIKRFLPQGSGLLSLFLYALIITILAVTVTYQLTKLSKQVEKK